MMREWKPEGSLYCRAWVVAVVLCVAAQAGGMDWSRRAREVAAARLAADESPDADHRQDRGTAAASLPLDAPAIRLVADEADAVPETQPVDGAEECPPIERGPLPGLFETISRDVKEAPGLLWEDTKAVYGNPWNLLFLLGAGGASAALRPEVDDDIEDHYRTSNTFRGNADWNDVFATAGNPATHFGVAVLMYYVGQQMQHTKTYEVGKRMISALAITGASTMFLKVAANTESPNGEELAWPSGHVSSTMAIATVLNDAYGPLVGVPMFGLTALVGVERLDSEEHHFSDLIFGAALGWVVAETVMKEHRPEIFGGEIVPYVDPAGRHAGVAWVKPLGQ
ncbi:MAG: hypothetical protein AMXMBFR13_15280 [Phycisphaerae bacterium]